MLNRKLISRGDIYFIDLSPSVGSEQGGKRPCVVVSNNMANRYSPCITVIPLTTSTTKANIPTHCDLSSETDGVRHSSTALCEQIRTVDKSRIVNKVGALSAEAMTKLESAIKIHLGV